MSDSPGLSILIPVYNYDVRKLIEDLTRQCASLNFPYEIRCYDDHSSESFSHLNSSISSCPSTIYKVLQYNIGRSAIRNLLAREAKFQYLLFIDADSQIVSGQFVHNYLAHKTETSVLAGGTIYSGELQPQFSLRYTYGKNREQVNAERRNKNPYLYITLNNLFVPKQVFLSINLDESIKTYGHEDTKFGYSLKRNNISVKHLDNPVEHVGLETNDTFLEKTREGIKNFYKIIHEGYGLDSKLYKAFDFLKRYRLARMFQLYYTLRRKGIENNLHSKTPSLFFFDLYKLHLLVKEDLTSDKVKK